MSLLGRVFNPIGPLEGMAAREVGPPVLRRIEASIGRRPLMPLVGLGATVVGMGLIVALTISAGAHADNFAGAPGEVLDAAQFRPWFRISLMAGVGVLLIGILTLLLAITVQLWWVTYTNRHLLPLVLDAVREREGKLRLVSARRSREERN